MAKYICSICGYVYDEAIEKEKFEALPNDWTCPLCGANKNAFTLKNEETKVIKVAFKEDDKKNGVYKNIEKSVICSNLAKGCEKQYLAKEAELFNRLSEYFYQYSEKDGLSDFAKLKENANNDIEGLYRIANKIADEIGDRGAKRALLWSEKVTKILISILERYQANEFSVLKNTKIFVCDICGFVYIGDNPPEVCPVCKVPRQKILEIGRE